MTDEQPVSTTDRPTGHGAAQPPPPRRQPPCRRGFVVALACLLAMVGTLMLYQRSPSGRVASLLDQLRPPGPAETVLRQAGLLKYRRVNWSELIKQLAARGPDAVPPLAAALKDENEDVRMAAAEALGRIGPAAEAAVPALISVLTNERPPVRPPGALLFLKKPLGHGNENVPGMVADTLGRIGPAAGAGAPALVQALGDRDEFIRARAAGAIGRVGAAASRAVPALIEALKDPQRAVRAGAASSLGKIAPVTDDVVPALIRALGDGHWGVRAAAAHALGDIGPAAATAPAADQDAPARAIPRLIAALKDKEWEVSREAAWALGEIDPAAGEVVAALKEALDDQSTSVRIAAAAALKKIEHADEDQ